MSECDIESAVTDWVIEHPETQAVFQDLGIDHSCGGKSLAYACRERGLDAESVLSTLQRAIAANLLAAQSRAASPSDDSST